MRVLERDRGVAVVPATSVDRLGDALWRGACECGASAVRRSEDDAAAWADAHRCPPR